MMFIIEWLLDRIFPRPEVPQPPAVAVNVTQKQTVKKTVRRATKPKIQNAPNSTKAQREKAKAAVKKAKK